MSTVDKSFADNIIRHNRYYDGNSENYLGDNPRCDRIIRYTNAWGKDAYGLLFEGQANKYTESLYVISPELYWQFSPTGEQIGTFWSDVNSSESADQPDISDDIYDEDSKDDEDAEEEEEDEDEDEDD
jgi:hypothetical protein